jgi:hypothetical protein
MAVAALGLTIAVTAGVAQAATIVIDTTPSWDGSSTVFPSGHDSVTETYGQSVTAPAYASSLQGFSFIIQDVNDFEGLGVPGPITYQAYVYQWDSAGGHLTGPALWTSPMLQTSGTNTGAFLTTSFATPGVAVTPNQQYMLFLTTDGIASPTDGNTDWAFPFSDVYAGGAFRFVNSANFADLSTTAWSDSSAFGSGAGDDLIFTAAFAVPEPMSVGLFGCALAGLVLLHRRQDRNAAVTGSSAA